MILIRTSGAWKQCLYATLAGAMTLGCSQGTSCSAIAVFGLDVTVLRSDGSRVCDGVVTARDGSYAETLQVLGDATNCEYDGATERVGTYTIEVAAGAQTKTVSGITVGRDECHVIAQRTTVTLEP